MSHTGAEEHAAVQYRLNQHDEIAWVGDSWLAFAAANDAPRTHARTGSQSVAVGVHRRPDHRAPVRPDVARVRRDEVVRFRFRCDGPRRQRSLEMTIQLTLGDMVEFATRLLRVEDLR